MTKPLTITLFLVLVSAPALADQLVLKNGDRLTGKIVKSDGEKLMVQTELVGDVTVALSAVTNLTSDQPLYVTLADGRTVSGTMTASETKAELRATNAREVSFLSHRFSPRVSLKEQLYFFPNITRGGEYRVNFDTTLVTDVTRRIGWQLTLSDRYLSNPPIGFEENDLLLTTGLKIKLGELK